LGYSYSDQKASLPSGAGFLDLRALSLRAVMSLCAGLGPMVPRAYRAEAFRKEVADRTTVWAREFLRRISLYVSRSHSEERRER